jgi:hypothetical protein
VCVVNENPYRDNTLSNTICSICVPGVELLQVARLGDRPESLLSALVARDLTGIWQDSLSQWGGGS